MPPQELERAKKVTVTFLTNIMLKEKVSLPTQTQELFLTTFNDKVCTCFSFTLRQPRMGCHHTTVFLFAPTACRVRQQGNER